MPSTSSSARVPRANSIRLDLPRFTLIGATTRAGQLSAPLRDRFGVTLRLELYTPEELALIVTRSRGHPERAHRAGRRLWRSPGARGAHPVSPTGCCAGCGTLPRSWLTASSPRTWRTRRCCALEVDRLGLDNVDRRMLRAIIENYGGGPVGLDTLAATIGEESVTLEDVYEPYLMQLGFLTRTPRGRCVTQKAYEHLHVAFVGQQRLDL